MKCKKSIITILFLSLFSSCEDFTGKNLDFVETKSEIPFSIIDNLLSTPTLINQGEYSMEKHLANTSLYIMSPLVEDLNINIQELSAGLNQHCHTIDALPTLSLESLEKLKGPLREKWKRANLTYHKLELMNFGPSADPNSTSLKSIYSFDGEIKCRVDLSLIQLSTRGRFPRTDVINNYNVRGLDALEPILFSDPNESRCKRVTPRITTWLSKPLIEREKVNCKYAKHLLKDMTKKSEELKKAWSPTGGNFSSVLLRGKLGPPIEALNKISQSLFYLDTEIKDIRISYPVGFDVRIDEVIKKCPTETCPENIENYYSDESLNSLVASLEGFNNLFTGLEGFGFDDLLDSRGHSEISTALKIATESAILNLKKQAKTKNLKDLLKEYDAEKCLETTTENRLIEVCAIVLDIRKITDILKNEYLLALQELSAPRGAQGDND
jgi:hypothetical protein